VNVWNADVFSRGRDDERIRAPRHNWLRTLPYVRAWAQRYQQQLVVVGVHTPEFVWHLVMGPPRQGTSIRFRVAIDGQPPGSAHGAEVDDGGHGAVVEQRLYQLIRQRSPIVDRQFEIEFLDVGVETFAFSFG
jgi:hypothetical protein